MKRVIVLTLCLCFISTALGEMSARICLPDGNTLSEPAEIMVGTTVSIVISSDDIGYDEEWIGGLALMDANSDYAVLYGRGCNGNCPNSCLPAAGWYAVVERWLQPGIFGFNMCGGYIYSEPGDWFIIDYNAFEVGDCKVGFYTHIPNSNSILNRYLEFTHIPSRDFNPDGVVDFGDLSIFANYWLNTGYTDPQQCEGTDLDADGDIDFFDYSRFASYWLERTDKRWWPE